MKAQAVAPKAPASERYGGARLMAAALGIAAGLGLAYLHFDSVPPLPGERVRHIVAGAGIAAGWSSWRLAGIGLGRGLGWAVIRGVTAAAVAGVVFCLGAATWVTVAALSYIRFSDAMELIFHLLQRAMGVAEALAASPASGLSAAAGVAISLTAEALHARWRWRGVEATASGPAAATGIPAQGVLVRRR